MANVDNQSDHSNGSLLRDLVGALTETDGSCRVVGSEHRDIGRPRVSHEFSIGINPLADSEIERRSISVPILSLLNPFRRVKVAIPSLPGIFRSNDSPETLQASIQSRLSEELTEFRESALNVRLNDARERTEELFDNADQPSLRNPTAYSPAIGKIYIFRQFLRRGNIQPRKATNASMITDPKLFEVIPMSNQSDTNE